MNYVQGAQILYKSGNLRSALICVKPVFTEGLGGH